MDNKNIEIPNLIPEDELTYILEEIDDANEEIEDLINEEV